ncbi:hypothetical protein NEIPOLOT_01728 [Neisseria polysaccharea ATCC 43768]|nr:hypothetical protein NEIPOLOT_01728 [Neisseria polysaccharea ATCC 43768]
MELRTFGTGQNVIYASLTAFPKSIFGLYLKECEWRFNNSEIKVQISILKQLVKSSLS